MKYRTPILVTLISASMLFTSAAFAQQAMASPTGASTAGNSTTFNSTQGQVTINSTMAKTPPTVSPPSFEQLSGGKKVISKDDASAYPPLANDFEYAANGGNSITKTQYQRWLQNLN
jgi:hypothetical protein